MMEIFGIIGLIIVSIAVWLREKNQDILFVLGGLCLLIYSASIGSLIFIILQLVFIISAGVELLKNKK